MFLAGFLSEALALAGTPANEIVVDAACTFVGPRPDRELTTVDVQALGRVPGLTAGAFREVVAAARRKSMRSIGVREDFPGALQAELRSFMESRRRSPR
jgi:hypothetical protein